MRRGEKGYGGVKIKAQADPDRVALSAHCLYFDTTAAGASFHVLLLKESMESATFAQNSGEKKARKIKGLKGNQDWRNISLFSRKPSGKKKKLFF